MTKSLTICLAFSCLLRPFIGESIADDASQLIPIPTKLVVLNFDDANKSDRAYVADVLKKYKFGATFYVTEGLGFLHRAVSVGGAEID